MKAQWMLRSVEHMAVQTRRHCLLVPGEALVGLWAGKRVTDSGAENSNRSFVTSLWGDLQLVAWFLHMSISIHSEAC